MGDPTLKPVPAADIVVLLAVLGRHEGQLRARSVNDHGVRRLGRRCGIAGLLPDESAADREAVAGVLADIGQRLRYSVGEYESDPTAD